MRITKPGDLEQKFETSSHLNHDWWWCCDGTKLLATVYVRLRLKIIHRPVSVRGQETEEQGTEDEDRSSDWPSRQDTGHPRV